MARDIEPTQAKPPIVKRAVAGAVLLVAAALAIHLLLGVIMTIFWIVVVVAIVGAVLWAAKTLIW